MYNGEQEWTEFVIYSSCGQYTGLKDINNTEIYKDDILICCEDRQYNDETIGVVRYSEPPFSQFIIEWNDGDICSNFNDASHWNIRVIGNIYENPQLLEGE
jgi:uncharacterized phage protein (TIGR01671 family)